MSYTWRFRLDEMNANPTWCDIFQIKQHGPLGVAPYMAFEANKANLTIDTEKLGVVAHGPAVDDHGHLDQRQRDHQVRRRRLARAAR